MFELHTFEIEMKEIQPNGCLYTTRRTARAETYEQVIENYGLDEPDIESYTIIQLD